MSGTAVGVAAVVEAKSSNKTGGKKSARGKGTAAGKEDPRHTWNHQLMEACLQCDLPKVKELVERGADPVNAREAPPRSFYYGALGNALEALQQQQRKDVHSTPDFQAAGGGVTNADGSTGFDTYGSSAAALAGDHAAAGHHPSSGPTSHADGTAAQASAADRLPPLAMMLLSGLDTPAAREVVAYLIQQGASVNDTFEFAAPRHHVAAADIASAAAAGGRGKGSAGADGSGKAAGSRSISADAKKSIKKKASMVAANSRSNSLALAPATAADAGNAAAAAATGGGVLKAGEVMVTGTVAHYVVCKGDHAQLLRLLLLAGPDAFPTAEAAGGEAGSTPVALPYALLTAVEQETVVGALRQHHLASLQHSAKSMSISKASAAAEGAGGQRGKGKPSSTSPSTSAPVSPHHGGSSLSTSQGGAAPFVVSPAAAEAVLAALQQRLGGMHSSAQRAPTSGASAGGGGGADSSGNAVDLRQRLPVLASAYPVMPETLSTAEGEAAVREMQLAAVVDTDAALHSLSATWWSLRKVCRKDSSTGVASAADVAAAPPSNSSAADAALMPQPPSAAVAPLAQRIELNLSLVDSLGRFATSIALERGDTLAFRLLHFFGATVPFAGLVNASQTRLARACASGDVALVERLLQQGDNVAQISADGRYTLVHYAAAQPEVLKLLLERGLSLEHQNAMGESAVLSLLRYGTARNDAKYVASLHGQAAAAVGGEGGAAPATAPGTSTHPVGAAANGQATTTAATAAAVAAAPVSAAVRNAVAFTQLSPAAQRNYILCPPLQLPSMGPGATNTSASAAQGGSGGGGSAAAAGGGGAASRSATIKDRVTSASARRASATAAATAAQSSFLSGSAAGGSGDVEQPFFGGREVGTWWSHLPPTSTTADVLDTLLKAGAVLQGYVPDEDLELPYVRFAEMQAAGGNDAGFPALGNRRNNSDDSAGHDVAQQLDDSDASRASLFTSTHTAVPGGPNRSNSRSYGTALPHRPLPFPGRLPLRLTPLQQAILDYHPELIRRLVVDYRVDPTQRDSQGATALHYAALCTHAPSVLELLLSPQVMQMHVKSAAAAAGGMAGGGTQTNAASVANSGGTNNSNNSGSAAATAEALISVSAAVNSKLDINCVDMAGRTPLFYAALVGNEAAVRLLLRFGSLAQVGRPDRDGWTPLHVAVRQQHPAVVEALLQHSSRLLSTAAAGNSDAAMELLNTPAGASAARRASLRAGGRRSSSRQRAGSFNSTGSARSRRSGSGTNGGGGSGGASGGGPATAYGAASPTDYLYANGALSLVDVEAEERDGHMTPLELVVKSVTPYTPASAAQQRMVTALLAEGQASAMRPSGLESGGSLLHRVVADGQVELAELLLAYFADVDEADDNDETPLFLAVRQPHLKVERLDGTHAGRTDSSSGNDTSAYAQECRTALVRVLLQHGATPYAQSGVNLQTPLHLAASTLAHPTEDAAEVMQMLFYTVPDRKAAVGRRGRLGSRSRDHRVLSRVLEAMDTDGDGTHRALGRSGAAGRRHGGGAGETAAGQRRRRNRSLLNSNGSVASGGRQPQGRLQDSGSGGGRRHQRWSGAGGNFSESEAAEATMEGDVSDALSLGNSSFASGGNHHHHHTTHDDADDDVNEDRSAASSRLGSAEKGVGQPADSPSEERLAMSEADRRRAMLREWQSADHLLAPAHCWLLTNAHGQTPLHVLCSSACRAVQRNSVVWKLLADLQTATAERETADQEVLRMLWSLPDSEGRTPLHAAALSGFVEAMERILEVCPAAVAAVDAQGRTPLHACVLMRGDASAPETGDDGSRDEAGAAQLHRLLCTLRDGFDAALSENSGRSGGGGGAAVPLQGLRMHHTNRDVLPTPRLASSTAPPSAVGGDGSATARRELAARGRATAALVQSSSITTQILRWQKTRHWGAPALMSAAADAATPAAATSSAAGMSAPTLYTPTDERLARLRGDEDAVRSWREYVQLPDGHGRTALLLAAEVGNRSAARELLRQA